MNLRFIFGAMKPFLGVLDLKIDRTRQIITFQRDGKAETLTVDQLYDEIESIFSKAKPAMPVQRRPDVTLDPFGGGTIERIEGSWLPDCNEPAVNPRARLYN